MKAKVLMLAIWGLSFAFEIKAQEEFVEPPSKEVVTIPFTLLTGGIVIINALFSDKPDTLNFVLDTGSSGISLDSLTAEYFGMQPQKSGRRIRGIGGVKEVSFLYNQSLHFLGHTVDSLNFHIGDYEMLTAIYGLKIDGIIGYSLLSRYIVRIDYDSLRITLSTQGSMRYPKGGTLLNPNFNKKIPTQTARLKDNRSMKADFLYDMGAGVCLLLSEDFIADSSVMRKNKKMLGKDGEGFGGRVNLKATTIKQLKIGPYKFKKVPTYIFNDEYDITSYPYNGGILGNEILRRFNCILNYAKGEIHLLPNSHFFDPFDYSYSGVELYWINGDIVIGSIIEGSNADKVGLKQGDIVVAIDKDMSQDINRYKKALQAANSKVKIIISRNGEVQEYKFKIKSIL